MPKGSKRILMIGPFPEPVTGMSLANEVLRKGLIRKGHSVSTINDSPSFFDENPGSFSLKKMIHFLKQNLFLYKIFKADVVYITPGHTFFGVLKYALFLLTGTIGRKKRVIHVHSNILIHEYTNMSSVKQKVVKNTLKRADRGIVLSPTLVQNLAPFLSRNNISVVKNFVEPKFILSREDIENKEYAEKRILFLGNLMTSKGIFVFLEALEILQKQDTLFKVRIAGNIDSDVEKEVLKRIKSISKASYLGVVVGNEKRDLLLWANTFVFPSLLMEGLPISILEALASGCRVISTEHPSLKDFFDKDAITYINKNSVADLVAALSVNTKDHNLTERIKNNLYIREEFHVEAYLDSIEEILI